MSKPRILLYDIETAPLQAYAWGIYDQNISVNQIVQDWHLLSYSAKWFGEPSIFYQDQRKEKDITNDKKLAQSLWDLLDQADIVITQNGKEFDQKKVYARFIYHGMKPPSPSKHIDTKKIAKKNFGFTSNGLEYLSEKLTQTKKSQHKKFPGMELWKGCLKGNIEAWNEMRDYNKQDVVALEALYEKLRAWDNSVNVALAGDGCRSCGSHDLIARGYDYTAAGKQQKYQCKGCGAWCKSSANLLTKKEREGVKRKI